MQTRRLLYYSHSLRTVAKTDGEHFTLRLKMCSLSAWKIEQKRKDFSYEKSLPISRWNLSQVDCCPYILEAKLHVVLLDTIGKLCRMFRFSWLESGDLSRILDITVGNNMFFPKFGIVVRTDPIRSICKGRTHHVSTPSR